MELKNKRIIVTGTGRGIGKALVEAMSTYDVTIIAVDRHKDRLEELKKGIAKKARVITYVCDVGSQKAVDTLIDYALKKIGGIDIFIANAGFSYYEKIMRPDWKHIENIFETNDFSPIYAAEKMKVVMKGKPYYFLVIDSAVSKLPLPGYSLYCSTKAALDSFAESYRYELSKNATFALCYPIATKTDFFNSAGKDVPVPSPAQTPEQVAKAVIRGIIKNKESIYPSKTFRAFMVVDRLCPPLARWYQNKEAKGFKGQ